MSATSEIVIIGGGVIGLAIAVELKRRGATVTVLSRDFQQAASHAAAGMLAPLAEKIASPAMLELCLKSRWLYPDWISKLDEITGVDTGYLPCGILAPIFEGNRQQGIGNTDSTATWLDKDAIELYQPGLGKDVVGGWWYPEDGQVDNCQLVKSLLQAAQSLGVKIKEGVNVEAIEQKQGKVTSVFTSAGKFKGDRYILTSGSWANQLLPLPVRPVKGQMLAVRMPQINYQSFPLQRILYGSHSYLVPRKDGRLIIGATVEEVGWTPHNTPNGIKNLLDKAIKLYPALADWAMVEFWWGFRPGTPDELPILGTSSCENLILATGHYRNGILLAPVTASLIADLILEQKVDPLLKHFSCDRFYNKSSQTSSAMTHSTNNGHIQSRSPENQIAPLHLCTSAPLPSHSPDTDTEDKLVIAGRTFDSRLMTGTGKYPSIEAMQQSVIASNCQIVTVAVRRVQTNAPGHEGLAEALDWNKIWMLPNTAGCQTAEEAIRVARLGREMAKLLGQEDNNFVKLEVIPDAKYLLPDPIGTLEAAEQLVKEGFAVLPYINADPLLAKRLEEVGCATVMPLGSPIGSGQGIKNAANIAIIIEEAKIPVVVDAGIGTPSEAAYSMELGADALLINSAIALARNPVAMAKAMGMAAEAGRLAYLSGRIPVKTYASASSPLTGTITE
ncbi:MAG: glycine oxidase ThiO [Xenococcaceae cyanobacterium]